MTTETIDLTAVIRNFKVDQGKSQTVPFAISRNGVPLDMSATGWSARLVVRDGYTGQVIINATDANSKLVWVDKSTGQLSWVLAPADTSTAGNAKIVFKKDEDSKIYVYDLELTSPLGSVYCPCKGTLEIFPEATK